MVALGGQKGSTSRSLPACLTPTGGLIWRAADGGASMAAAAEMEARV